ncbi:hypothetical protein CsSME_00041616 [Camellia sinensis var. sinensis]
MHKRNGQHHHIKCYSIFPRRQLEWRAKQYRVFMWVVVLIIFSHQSHRGTDVVKVKF